jgi:hypothetical protein
MKHIIPCERDTSALPPLAWLLVSGAGGALAAMIVAGVVAGRAGLPISGALLLAAALLGALPQLLAVARGRWATRWPELAATVAGLLAVGGVGFWLAWPSLLPLGLSVDSVHHYQLVRWIAEHGSFPPHDGETVGLMGEMVGYPPGVALVVVGVSALLGRPALDVLYPVIATIGGLTAALVVLLGGAGADFRMKNEELRKMDRQRFLYFLVPALHFLALLIGPLLLLAHRVYTLDAYTDQSYYAMVLGVLLVLLAAGHLIVAPRLTPIGAAQLGVVLAALVGVYPLWVAIPGGLAVLSIAFSRYASAENRAETYEAPSAPARQNRTIFASLRLRMSKLAIAGRSVRRAWPRKVLLGGLALLPALALGLFDLPARLRVGQLVLAHQGFVSLPTAENLVPLLLALPCAVLLLASRAKAARRLIGLAALALAMLLALSVAARAGYTASYHAYKLLFVLAPLAAAIAGAAALRLAWIERPLPRAVALAAAAGVLLLGGSLNILPPPAVQSLTPDLVAAAGWLSEHRPRDAKRAIAVGAPAGPVDYWVQIGLLGQRRDKAELALRAFDAPPPSPEGWVIDETLPKFVIAPQIEQLPPGAEVVARFGAAAVLRRAPEFDISTLDPLLVRYRALWQDQRIHAQLEVVQRLPGRTPLLELRLAGAGGWVAAFPLQPDATRTRPQYIGLELDPATLGASGYINRDAYPTFEPPAGAPTGALTLTLRLALDGNTLEERTLATFHRTAGGVLEQISAGGGELVYRRQPEETTTAHTGGARLADDLLLAGWSQPERTASQGTLATSLRWQAMRPIGRSLFVELHVVDAGGNVVAASLAPPQQGFYPAWRWRPGDTVTDRQSIELPHNLPPGIYRLEVSTRDFGTLELMASGTARIGEFVIE